MAHHRIILGDALTNLKGLDDESVQCCVTSPPYWGLRDYGIAGQIGLEKTPEEYVKKLVDVFREVRRVLAKDGTFWLNLGDSYASAWSCDRRNVVGQGSLKNGKREARPNRLVGGLKEKDLVGIPWMVAFALRADGWYLRQDIIWHKPNPMPESVTDRPTRAHEYIFLFAKSHRYYYDHEAIREPAQESSIKRLSQKTFHQQTGGPKDYGHGQNPNRSIRKVAERQREKLDKQRGHERPHEGFDDKWDQMSKADQQAMGANKRSVWTVATQPFPDAHFATFPPKLIEPCILAGSRPNDTVLDPFCGAGTTGLVSLRHGRCFVGIELNPDYIEMASRRIVGDAPLFNNKEQ